MNQKRIPITGGQKLAQNPFATLSSDGLPSAPDEVAMSEAPARSAAEAKAAKKNRGRVDIVRQTKGRGGKTVTVVTGFVGIGLPEKAQLAKTMQRACGTGGTVKEGRIEIQGDQRAEVARILGEAGFRPVFAGGYSSPHQAARPSTDFNRLLGRRRFAREQERPSRKSSGNRTIKRNAASTTPTPAGLQWHPKPARRSRVPDEAHPHQRFPATVQNSLPPANAPCSPGTHAPTTLLPASNPTPSPAPRRSLGMSKSRRCRCDTPACAACLRLLRNAPNTVGMDR